MRVVIAATLALLATPAAAVVTGGALTGGTAFSNGGQFLAIAPPVAVGFNNFQDNNVRAFNEKQLVTLGSALAIDLGLNSATSIAAGTVVRSHFVNFDPLQGRRAVGTVSFSTPVLGLIWSRSGLIASNPILGAPGVTYNTPGNVGFEPGDLASFTGSTVSFDLSASNPGDSFRVVTAAVPEPATWAMLIAGFGLVGVMARRRQQRRIAA
jgi:hypothetical protein